MSASPLEIAVLGDLHGDFDLALDAPLLEPYSLRLCTGDLTPNRGRERFDDAVRQARGLAAVGAYTVLGNHDGPTGFTGRSFPASYEKLVAALGPFDIGMRRIELPSLELTLVGARPLAMGGTDLRYVPPGCEGRDPSRWADEIAGLIMEAQQERIVVLAHDGPAGLGSARDSIYGCDFRAEAGDWGDADLALALEIVRGAGRRVVAVIAGHMHHALRGGGTRTWQVRDGGVLHVNAAIVPRVDERGRALVIVSLDGFAASARIEWFGAPESA